MAEWWDVGNSPWLSVLKKLREEEANKTRQASRPSTASDWTPPEERRYTADFDIRDRVREAARPTSTPTVSYNIRDRVRDAARPAPTVDYNIRDRVRDAQRPSQTVPQVSQSYLPAVYNQRPQPQVPPEQDRRRPSAVQRPQQPVSPSPWTAPGSVDLGWTGQPQQQQQPQPENPYQYLNQWSQNEDEKQRQQQLRNVPLDPWVQRWQQQRAEQMAPQRPDYGKLWQNQANQLLHGTTPPEEQRGLLDAWFPGLTPSLNRVRQNTDRFDIYNLTKEFEESESLAVANRARSQRAQDTPEDASRYQRGVNGLKTGLDMLQAIDDWRNRESLSLGMGGEGDPILGHLPRVTVQEGMNAIGQALWDGWQDVWAGPAEGADDVGDALGFLFNHLTNAWQQDGGDFVRRFEQYMNEADDYRVPKDADPQTRQAYRTAQLVSPDRRNDVIQQLLDPDDWALKHIRQSGYYMGKAQDPTLPEEVRNRYAAMASDAYVRGHTTLRAKPDDVLAANRDWATELATDVLTAWSDPTELVAGSVGMLIGAIQAGRTMSKMASITPPKAVELLTKADDKAVQQLGKQLSQEWWRPLNDIVGPALTRGSKALIDTHLNFQQAQMLLGQARTVEDARVLLRTLAQNPKALIEGVPGLTSPIFQQAAVDGVSHFGTALAAPMFADSRKVLREVADSVARLPALQGSGVLDLEGKMNVLNQFRELVELAAWKKHGLTKAGKQALSRDIPVAAMTGNAVKQKDGTYIVQFIGPGGTVVETFATPLLKADADRLIAKVTEAATIGSKNLAQSFTDIQRGFMTAAYLNLRPDNWITQAVSAGGHLFTDGLMTFVPGKRIDDWLETMLGGMPTVRMTEGVDAKTLSGATPGQGLPRDKNRLEKLSQRVGNLPGLKQLNWLSEQGGKFWTGNEQKFYKRAFYKKTREMMNSEWGKAVQSSLSGAGLLELPGGMQLADAIEHAVLTGGPGGLMRAIDDLAAGNALPFVPKEFNIRNWDVAPHDFWRKLGETIATARQQGMQRDSFVQAVNDLAAEFSGSYWAELARNPVQAGRELFTQVEWAGDYKDLLGRAEKAAKAMGLDEAGTRQLMDEVRRQVDEWQAARDTAEQGLLQAVQVRDSVEAMRGLIGALEEIELQKLFYRTEQGKLYEMVESAGFAPEAWSQYFGQVRRIAEEMHDGTIDMMERTRQWLTGETPDPPRWATETGLDWLKRVLAADPAEVQRMRSLQPGSPQAGRELFEQAIEGNRLYTDQADARLYWLAKQAPSIDTADILVSQSRQRAAAAGAAAAERDEALALARNFQLPWDDYYKLRNEIWHRLAETERFFAEAAMHEIAELRLADEAKQALTWQMSPSDAGFILGETYGAAPQPVRLVRPGQTKQVSDPSKYKFQLPEGNRADAAIPTEGSWWYVQTADGLRHQVWYKDIPEQMIHRWQQYVDTLDDQILNLVEEAKQAVPDVAPAPATVIRPTATVSKPMPTASKAADAAPTPTETPQGPASRLPGQTPAQAAPNLNALRAKARQLEIGTITDQGRPYDTHLLNWVNKRLRLGIERLADLTSEQITQAVRRMDQEIAERASQMQLPDMPAAGRTPSSIEEINRADDALQAGQRWDTPRDETLTEYARMIAKGGRPEPILRHLNPQDRIKVLRQATDMGWSPSGRTPTPKPQPAEQAAPQAITDVAHVVGELTERMRALREARDNMMSVWNQARAKHQSIPTAQNLTGRLGLRGGGTPDVRFGGKHWEDYGPLQDFADSLIGAGAKVADVADWLRQYANANQEIGQITKQLGEIAQSQGVRSLRELERKIAKDLSPNLDRLSNKEIIARYGDRIKAMWQLSDQELAQASRTDLKDMADAVVREMQGARPTGAGGTLLYSFPGNLGPYVQKAFEGGQDLWKVWRENGRARAAAGTIAPTPSDGAKFVSEQMGAIARQIAAQADEILTGRPAAWTPEQLAHLRRWANEEGLPLLQDVMAGSVEVGKQAADFALLDYSKRRGFDTMLQYVLPYHYWMTRSAMNWIGRSAMRPDILADFARTEKAMSGYHEQEGSPRRMGGRLPIPGTDLFIQTPSRMMIPYADLYMREQFDDEVKSDKWYWQMYDTLNNFGFSFFPLYHNFAMMKQGREGEIRNLLPQGALLSYGMQAMGKRMPDLPDVQIPGVGTLPLSQLLQGRDQWDPYREARKVGELVQEGKIPAHMGQWVQDVIAQNYGQVEGPLPEQPPGVEEYMPQVIQAVGRDRAIQLFSNFFGGLSISRYPQAERQLKDASRLYNQRGYDAETNPAGSDRAAHQTIEDEPALPTWWSKNFSIPGVQDPADRPGRRAATSMAYDAQGELREDKDAAEEKIYTESPGAPAEEFRKRLHQMGLTSEQIEVEVRKRYPSANLPDRMAPPTREQAWDRYTEDTLPASLGGLDRGQAPWEANEKAATSAVYDFWKEEGTKRPQQPENYDTSWVAKAKHIKDMAAWEAGELKRFAKYIRDNGIEVPGGMTVEEWYNLISARGKGPAETKARGAKDAFYQDRYQFVLDAEEKFGPWVWQAQDEYSRLMDEREQLYPDFEEMGTTYDAMKAQRAELFPNWEQIKADRQRVEDGTLTWRQFWDRNPNASEAWDYDNAFWEQYPWAGEAWDYTDAFFEKYPQMGEFWDWKEANYPEWPFEDEEGNYAWKGQAMGPAPADASSDAVAGSSEAERAYTPGTGGSGGGRPSSSGSYRPGGGGNQWSSYWDEYRGLGDNWAAKAQFMRDNPEFAAYYIGQYGEDSAWWLDYSGGGSGGGSYGGGGGWGGGGRRSRPVYTDTPYVQARGMDRDLWDSPAQRWLPRYEAPRDNTWQWLQSGEMLRPRRMEDWRPPYTRS